MTTPNFDNLPPHITSSDNTSGPNKRTAFPLLMVAVVLGGLSLAAAQFWPDVDAWPARYACVAAFFAWAIRARGGLTSWIVVAMITGVIVGHDYTHYKQLWNLPDADILQLPSKIFLKLIKTVIAPLLFSTLVVGIAGHADLKQVGRMGLKSLIYFELVTTVALFLGLGAINLSQAGVGIPQPAHQIAKPHLESPKSFVDIILHIFPENLAKSVAEGDVLQVVVFSVLFGIAVAMVGAAHRKVMLEVIESLAEVMFKFTGNIMLLAPIAVGSAVAYTSAEMGPEAFFSLFKLLLTLYCALAVFMVFVLLPIAYFTGVPVRAFIRAVAEPVSIAFATASSEAALPRAMERLELLGVPRSVVSFVLPTGYSFNLDGSTLYLSLAAVFVAQAAGKPMTFSEQILIVVTLMLTSKGVAGIPRATLVILLGTVSSFGLPEWPVLTIMGIDGLMDMARTAVNVTGNCLASVVIARWEGIFVPNLASGLYGNEPAKVELLGSESQP